MKRKLAWSALAISAVLIVWVGMRVMAPPVLAYHPPKILE